jgi:hypothetical protein
MMKPVVMLEDYGAAEGQSFARYSDLPIIVHSEREYHLFWLKRSKKNAIEIFKNPRAAIAETIDCMKPIFS